MRSLDMDEGLPPELLPGAGLASLSWLVRQRGGQLAACMPGLPPELRRVREVLGGLPPELGPGAGLAACLA